MRLRRRGLRVIVAVGTAATLTVGLSACSSNDRTLTSAATAEVAGTSSAAPAPSPSSPTSSSPTPTSPTAEPTPEPATSAPEPTPEPPPPAPVDPLTGGAPSGNPVLAVKIENTAGGWPQYGTGQADVVYVEQVEGGLTRLLALFHSSLPEEVGAVRSLRTTDTEVLPAYGSPALLFSGGAGGPLDALADTPVVDASGMGVTWRSSAAKAPYNLHANLQQLAAAVGDRSPARDAGFTFAAGDPRLDAAPAVTSIAVQFQAARAAFSWNGSTYAVQRNGGSAADAQGTAITADNVVVMNVTAEPDGVVDSVGSPSYISHTVGDGTFTLFRNGRALDGHWWRGAADQPFRYEDASGAALPFAPGRTWIVLATQTTTTETG